jgi:hypothetical protein
LLTVVGGVPSDVAERAMLSALKFDTPARMT